jgi:hypothetical protein
MAHLGICSSFAAWRRASNAGCFSLSPAYFTKLKGQIPSYTRDCDGGNVCPPPPSTILARGTKSQCFARISTCEQTVGKSLFGHHRRPEIQSKHVERRLIVEVIHEVNRIVTTETPAVMIGSGEGRFR